MKKMCEIECSFYDGICKSPINKSDLECSLIPVERCYYKQLQQLKAANEELQKEMQEEINATQKWYQEHTNEKFKADKYKQCLDEIEEIVNKHYATILEFYKAIKKIQQKINEVKGND